MATQDHTADGDEITPAPRTLTPGGLRRPGSWPPSAAPALY